MKQILENLRSGKVTVADVPPTLCRPSGVLVRTLASFVSSGTERASLRMGSRTLVGKALARPELARQVIARLRSVGPAAVMSSVRARLEQPLPLGYSSAGVVVEVGSAADQFAAGDRVACAGAGYAGHAELNWVPKNLCVSVPPQVDLESAASAALGAVALQGVRVADARIGERVAVVGLGVIGLLTAQILKAAGCVVWAADPDAERVRLAHELGIEASATSSNNPWLDSSMDAVILTAATSSRGPIQLAGRLARDRGVVVVVGEVRVDVPRESYYAKELQIRYSRSYGPGRYDPRYEEHGLDYPYGFVRWTEKRNLEAYLRLLADGKVQVKPLISHRFPIEEAREAYALLAGKRPEKSVGIVLTFPDAATGISDEAAECRQRSSDFATEPGEPAPSRTQRLPAAMRPAKQIVRLGWIGAGSFSQSVLLPAMAKIEGVELTSVANRTGASAQQAARRFGFRRCSADAEEILNDPEIDAVVIATRHDLHARLIMAALERGKNVLVEKPLCISEDELATIESAYEVAERMLAVGFNRRFSPFAKECRGFFADAMAPLSIVYRVNAGRLPAGHWLRAPEQGDGRITGELCHFIDLVQFLSQSKPVEVFARAARRARRDHSAATAADPDLHVTIRLQDGSLAEIHYLCSGPEGLGKERIEVFAAERAAICDDFGRWRFVTGSRSRRRWLLRQDKGHQAELDGFIRAARGLERWPVEFAGVRGTMLATFRIAESLRTGRPVAV